MTPKHDALDGKQITLVDAGVKEGKVSSCLSGLTEKFSVPSKVDEVVGIRRRQRVGATFAVGGVGERQGCMGTCVGAIAAVIDVEDAARGDALADLATARVELQCALGSAAKETFTTLFLQHSDLDTHDLPLWELYASSASLAFMGVWGLPPDEEAHRRQHTQLCFAQALASMRAAQP